MTDFTNLISQAVAAKMTPEFIEKEVDTRVEKLVTESIDRALRTYSDTGKLIEQAVADALKVEQLDLPSYGSTVSGMLKAQIETLVAPIVSGRLAEDMAELLNLAPSEIKLSKIAEDMLEEADGDWGDLITVIVEENRHGSTWVYLDTTGADKRWTECNYSLLIRDDGTIASASINKRDLNDNQHIGRTYGLSQKIRSWYACRTKIILDEDYVVRGKGDY